MNIFALHCSSCNKCSLKDGEHYKKRAELTFQLLDAVSFLFGLSLLNMTIKSRRFTSRREFNHCSNDCSRERKCYAKKKVDYI
jgi:hypothetical protein